MHHTRKKDMTGDSHGPPNNQGEKERDARPLVHSSNAVGFMRRRDTDDTNSPSRTRPALFALPRNIYVCACAERLLARLLSNAHTSGQRVCKAVELHPHPLQGAGFPSRLCRRSARKFRALVQSWYPPAAGRLTRPRPRPWARVRRRRPCRVRPGRGPPPSCQ